MDERRQNRKIPYKLYLPKVVSDNKGLPLVVWSHGLGGGRDGAGFLSRYLAGHGYAVLNIQHPGTDVSLWQGKQGHPWDIIRNTDITWEDTLARFHDVPFVLDQLERGALPDKELLERIDLSRLGMSGHSYGALTTQVMAGQPYGPSQDDLSSYKEPRFKAHIAYSQLPHWQEKHPPETLYAPLDMPILCMTGTNDLSPLRGEPYEKRLRVDQYASHPDRRSVILKDGDHMVFAGSRGQLQGYDKIPEHERIIQVSSLAWWDWHLKGEQSAKKWLDSHLPDWAADEIIT